MISPFYPRGFVEHPPPRDDRPYGDRTAEELAGEAEWVRREYLGERTWEPSDGPVLPPVPDECYPPDAVPLEPIELVPGGGVSTLPGAPGTHHADGAVATGDGCAVAPSAQTPPPLPVVRESTDLVSQVGKGGGLTVAWAATGTALVITTVYALARVAQWHLLTGWG